MIRHCINMNKRFFFLLMAGTIIFRITVYSNSIFDGYSLSSGCQTKLEIPGGWGVYSKNALRGKYGYFLELHVLNSHTFDILSAFELFIFYFKKSFHHRLCCGCPSESKA